MMTHHLVEWPSVEPSLHCSITQSDNTMIKYASMHATASQSMHSSAKIIQLLFNSINIIFNINCWQKSLEIFKTFCDTNVNTLFFITAVKVLIFLMH